MLNSEEKRKVTTELYENARKALTNLITSVRVPVHLGIINDLSTWKGYLIKYFIPCIAHEIPENVKSGCFKRASQLPKLDHHQVVVFLSDMTNLWCHFDLKSVLLAYMTFFELLEELIKVLFLNRPKVELDSLSRCCIPFLPQENQQKKFVLRANGVIVEPEERFVCCIPHLRDMGTSTVACSDNLEEIITHRELLKKHTFSHVTQRLKKVSKDENEVIDILPDENPIPQKKARVEEEMAE